MAEIKTQDPTSTEELIKSAGFSLWQAYCDMKAQCEELREQLESLRATSQPVGVPEVEFDGYKGLNNVRWYINELHRVRIINQWLADAYCNKLREFVKTKHRGNQLDQRDVELRTNNEIADLWRGCKSQVENYWAVGQDKPDMQQFERIHDDVTKRLLSVLTASPTPPAAPEQVPTRPANSQEWAGMDGAIAWHLIERHADNWADVGLMMGEWLAANRSATPTAAGDEAKTTGIEALGDAIERALDEAPVSDVLSIITGTFVSLVTELTRRAGHNADKEIKVDGGDQRDITIHAAKAEAGKVGG